MNVRPETLLVVDDDDMARDMISRRLKRQGYEVASVARGGEALDRIAQDPVDLVLLDIEMPEMDGLTVLKAIRAFRSQSELPVIMATAKGDSATVVEALNAGANDFVVKPLDFPVVVARIRTQLARTRSELALRESEERYALATRASNEGFWDWDLSSDRVYYSARWKAMLGFQDHEVGPSFDEWLTRVHPDDKVRLQSSLQDLVGGRAEVIELEHRLLHRDNHYRWTFMRALAVRGEQGQALRMVGSVSDITTAKVADPLTGLPNRLLFADRLSHCLERRRRHPQFHFAVLFLDLDRFKDVNDSLGHLAGDQLLVQVAHRIESLIRSTDMVARAPARHTVARLGGDEFTVLLEDLSAPEHATVVAERLQQAIGLVFHIGDHEVFTSASMGIVVGTNPDQLAEDILRDADTAMYRAKADGRARYAVFDSALRDAAVERLQLGNDLKRAVQRSEFSLVYQPIVVLASGRLSGFEALIRWNHSKRGCVAPADFIEVAEETGLIVPIGQWVLHESCRQLAAWRQDDRLDDGLTVSVNMSGREFTQPGLVESVERVLAETGVPAGRVKLEITESVLMVHARAVAQRIFHLRALGLHIVLDDFGTGYSSLSYLHRFPVNTLKIDRSFVARLGSDRENTEIVRTIITLAHSLGLDVVAEGVETAEHHRRLVELGCEYGQGYRFARPASPEDARVWFAGDTTWAPPQAGTREPSHDPQHCT